MPRELAGRVSSLTEVLHGGRNDEDDSFLLCRGSAGNELAETKSRNGEYVDASYSSVSSADPPTDVNEAMAV